MATIRGIRNVVAAAVSAGLLVSTLVWGPAAAADPPPSPTSTSLTVIPPPPFTRCVDACVRIPSSGMVMGPTTVYVIFWQPEGYSFQPGVVGGDAQYMSLVERFFNDIGGSQLYNIVTQYPGTKPPYPGTTHQPPNSLTLGGTYVDTRPFPRSPMWDVDIDEEVKLAKVANGWLPDDPTDPTEDLFFVYTPAGVTTCVEHGGCSGVEFAGYHGAYMEDPDGQRLMTNTAFIPDLLSHRGGPVYPNGELIDTVLSTTAHELFEAVTDPFHSGWVYRTPDFGNVEIGDLCREAYGPMDSTGANMYLNGNPYQLQYIFSNAAPGCTNGFDGQFITFGPLVPKTTASPPFSLTAETSSLLPLTFSASGSCTVSGAQVTITGAGSCTITASQAGDKPLGGFYDPATPVTQTFSITDATPPVAAVTVTPAPNAAGWNNTVPVTVDWHWGDTDSGVDAANCTGPLVTSTEGSATVDGACRDLAGNQATGAQTVRIDTVAPVVSITGVTDGAVYGAGSVPVAGCATVDAGGSGVGTQASALTTGGPSTFTVNCQGAIDVAGNAQAASVSASYRVDATAPSLTPTVLGTLGQDGWYVSNVAVSWTVTDAESPVSTTVCPAGSITADTPGTSFSCRATSAGGTATTSVVVKRDATQPTAAITGVTAGSYPVGNVPAAGCSTSDAGGSLVATGATLTWTPNAPTTTGQYTATCSGARDGAGNAQTPVSLTITVTSPVANRADVTSTLSCAATMRLNVLATCTFTVRNAGPGTAQGIAATIALPKSLSGVAVNAGGTITKVGPLWKLPPLAANTSAVLTVTVKPVATGKVLVAAAALATTPDPNYLNNAAVSQVSVTR